MADNWMDEMWCVLIGSLQNQLMKNIMLRSTSYNVFNMDYNFQMKNIRAGMSIL
jgi:hypothetical protein